MTPHGHRSWGSAIVFRDDTVLLVHRSRNGTDTWVPPGGTLRPGESMAACARPGSTRRTVDLVFIATADGHGGNKPKPREPDLEARFVPLGLLPGLDVRPPLAGHLRVLHARGTEPTAAYLGNLWRPRAWDGMRPKGRA
jgi:8-oxo-dGTP diphosphatase